MDFPPSRPSTVSGHSSYSQPTSQRHMISGPLDQQPRQSRYPSNNLGTPPATPTSSFPFLATYSKESPSTKHSPNDSSGVSLSVNYLPSKFSQISTARKRKGGLDPIVPKFGGGVDAFRSGANRIRNDDDDGISGRRRKGKKARWNKFKWILFVANSVFSTYSLLSMIICLMAWFNIWERADIVRVGNRPELIISTLGAALGIITSLFGWAGILLNNRTFLAIYTFLLWITFIFIVMPGYITYKKITFNLEGKINAQWSRDLGTTGRLRIQNQLQCCGYFNPFIEATISQTCYSRSILPGCKLRYMQFERVVLKRWYTAAFCIAPVHIGIIIAGLLCSNHVTYRFGKGMMPKRYRLSLNSMAVIMDNYASQLAEQYGSDVASDVMARSRSNLHLDRSPDR